ncbi:hypothetical protein BGX24_010265 [Mortierella sp. AD032]|nr:hypothetical protein BGX24_010265 [Mortierella sp. AD032]
MIREIIQYTGSLHASRMHHRRVLDRVLYSPTRFFDITPLGRIINRLTHDMGTLNQQATNVSANLMVDFLGTLTVTGVIAYVTPQFLIPGLVIALLDEHNRPYLYLWVCNRWLSVYVDILSAFMSLFAGIFVILRRDTTDAGAAGLSLTYSLALTHHVVWFVRTLTFNKINMN